MKRWLAGLGRHFVSTYLAFDPRSLGAFRIALGLVLFLDLHLRYRGIDYWYTDGGIVPSLLIRSSHFSYIFSPFAYASSPAQVTFGMALCAFVYAMFTIGFATRLFHVLAIVAVTALNNRLFLLENSGHSVFNLLMIWSVFLPLGRRFSVDAWLARRRALRRGETRESATRHRPFVSLAVLALLLQFSAIYYFSAVQKTGERWWDGSAVHYVLHDERMNTGIAVWIRESVPYEVLRWMSWSTLAVEGLAVLLLLSPIWPRQLRLAAIVLLPALHIGFAAGLTLGIFSFAMIAFYFLLLAPSHWEWIARRGPFSRLAQSRAATEAPLPARAWTRYPTVVFRELAVLFLAAVCVSDLAVVNPAWPAALRFEQPQLFRAMIWYPRIRQYWLMFTPHPPDAVVGLAVEAVTEDGRIVDPYNEVASRYPRIPREAIPRHWGQDQPFSDYTTRISSPGFEWCHMAFANWVLAYSARTGNPADRIVSFRAFRVEALMPRPGSTAFGRPRFVQFFAFP